MLKRRWLAGLLVLMLLALSAPAGQAQSDESVGLRVVPAIIDQPLTPGVSTTVSIEVTNIAQRSLPVQVDPRPLVPLDPLVDETVRSRYDASAWVTPLTPEFILEPGETSSVQLSVRSADEAGPGGHYALIVFRVLTSDAPSQTSSTRVNPEVAVVALFNLPGATSEQLEQKLDQPPLWQAWTPSNLAFELINRGNVHVLPQSTIEFRPVVGGDLVNLPPVAPRLVLPGTISRFAADWPELEWGLYRVRVVTSFGTPLKSIESTSGWWFVPPPVWLQVIGLGLLLVVGFSLKRGLKRLGITRPLRFRLASDTKRGSQASTSDHELDFLSRESDVVDVSHKKRGPRS